MYIARIGGKQTPDSVVDCLPLYQDSILSSVIEIKNHEKLALFSNQQ